MTGKNRIRLAMGAVAAVSFGVSLLSLTYMNRMARRLTAIAAADVHLTEISESISIRILEARQAEKNYILFFDSTDIDLNVRLIDGVLTDVSRARRIAPHSAARFDSLVSLLGDYRENIQKLTFLSFENADKLTRVGRRLMQTERELQGLKHPQQSGLDGWTTDMQIALLAVSGELSPDKIRTLENLKRTGKQIMALTRKISDASRASLAANAEQALLLAARAQRDVLTLLLLSGVFLGVLMYYLPRRLFEPFSRILRALRAVGRGDVAFPLPGIESKDEIGELSRAFYEATRKIRYFNELVTEKIVEVKRNQQRVLEEIHEGVIITGPDYKITFMNQAARDLLQLKGEAVSLKDLPGLWNSLQARLDQVDPQDRSPIALKAGKLSVGALAVSVIPRTGKGGRVENILFLIR
ncbi:MAG TPA: HAMP domain-containing protein [bacterium]|nr:HAMP domain-containing protein [bacterium]